MPLKVPTRDVRNVKLMSISVNDLFYKFCANQEASTKRTFEISMIFFCLLLANKMVMENGVGIVSILIVATLVVGILASTVPEKKGITYDFRSELLTHGGLRATNATVPDVGIHDTGAGFCPRRVVTGSSMCDSLSQYADPVTQMCLQRSKNQQQDRQQGGHYYASFNSRPTTYGACTAKGGTFDRFGSCLMPMKVTTYEKKTQ